MLSNMLFSTYLIRRIVNLSINYYYTDNEQKSILVFVVNDMTHHNWMKIKLKYILFSSLRYYLLLPFLIGKYGLPMCFLLFAEDQELSVRAGLFEQPYVLRDH